MYVSKRSIPERSGAATLTALLTAGLLGAIMAMSRGAAPFPAGASKMQMFDVVAAADASEAPEPRPKPALHAVEQPAAPAPSPAPAIVREQGPAPETAPVMPIALAGEGIPTGEPAGPATGTARAAPAGAVAHASGAASSAVERREDPDPYGRTVFREIRARQTYPAELARAGFTGTVVVELRVSARGRIYAAVVISSENRALDRLALQQVQSTPLPPPPRGEPRTFRIPMTYRTR